MRTIDTGYLDLLSASSTNDTLNAVTGALPVFDIWNVQADVFIRARTLCQVRMGVQFSNNPFEFTDAAKELSATYFTNAGWNDDNTWHDIFALAGVTPRLFVRFVALGKNTSGSGSESMQIRVMIRVKPFRSRLVNTAFRRANTKGNDATWNAVPMSNPIATEGFSSHRVALDVSSMTGGLDVGLGYQQTNTPDDPSSWGTVTTLGSTVSADGVVFPTAFSSVSFTKKFVRYVVNCRNTSGGTEIEACHCAVRIELRGE